MHNLYRNVLELHPVSPIYGCFQRPKEALTVRAIDHVHFEIRPVFAGQFSVYVTAEQVDDLLTRKGTIVLWCTSHGHQGSRGTSLPKPVPPDLLLYRLPDH